ncbi:MAG: amino acid adenylation domain-containing protein [Nitrospirales bacterium]|nr:amino acid adenylation domain-containing protein [Nitrospirales bacterium]
MNVEHETIVDILRLWAHQAPQQQAYTFLVDGETEAVHVTYDELDRRARAIACRLQSLGVIGERALLLYPPGLDFITAFFGCLYAGVIAVPAYPPQRKRTLPRLQAILEDAQPKLALTTTQIYASVQRFCSQESGLNNLERLIWVSTDVLISDSETGWCMPEINSRTLAFLQYTSGSTGRPKGVMVSHGNLLDNERVIMEAFGHTGQTVVLGWLPLYHDMGLIGNVLQPLYLGVPCVLMSPVHFLQKPFRWLSAISRYRATTSGGPNFAYDLCVRQTTPDQRASLDLSCWTVAFNGAEPIHVATIDRFTDAFSGAGFRREALYPCYGLAEATLFVSGGDRAAPPVLRTIKRDALQERRILDATESDAEMQQLVGCGYSRLEQEIRIVDPEGLGICPVGRVGEVWVKGPSIAGGYWNRPEETSRTFEGYTSDTSEGPFLRTGDLGFVQDGELFITGRLKDLIIIRGRNYYPHDIERTAQQSHMSLRPEGGAAFSITLQEEESLVVVHEVESRRSSFNAEVVIAAIRQAIAEQHEVQVAAVVLIKAGTLPKTSSGKVQRSLCRMKFLAQALNVIGQSALPTSLLETGYETGEQADLVQGNELEAMIVELWSQVLQQPTIRLQDNFFAMGGDSLRGMQMLARVQEVWRVDVPFDALFEYPTAAEFAAHIETLVPSVGSISRLPIHRVPREGASPLSFAQERFWFLEQLSPGTPFNNIPIALRLKGVLDIEVLRRSLDEIICRHEILRATFVLRNGQPAQIIAPRLDLPLPIEHLQWVAELKREEQLQGLLGEEARRPFDLMKEPLLRLRLFRISEADHVLSLTIHHIIADGWSMGIFSRELAALYHAFMHGQVSPLPALPVQYLDMALQQRIGERESEFQRQVTYWRKRLDHAPHILDLPFDFPRPEVQGYRGARYEWVLDASVVRQLQAVGYRYRTTLFMTLLATFTILLSRYSGQSDLCVGTPVANRNRIESDSLIGCFVNTVALRADLSRNPPFPEFLDQIRVTVLGAQANQEIPFERLVDELRVERDLSRTPLFQVMFVLADRPLDIRALGGLEAYRMNVNTQTSAFDLTLEMAEKADGSLTAVFEYSTDLFASHTIVRMAEHLHTLVTEVVACPESRVGDFPMLTANERAYVLVDCNRTQAPYPDESCLHQLIEARVADSPGAVALLCEGRSYTYASINGKANQLARYLREQGVGPEIPVALCVDRSLEMVIGLLGALKAGTAYVPIDPTYPKDRQSIILKDVEPRLLLTQGRFSAELSDQAASVFALDTDWEGVSGFPDTNLPTLTSPDNLAYILYTSGTTGRPKGTGISHRALVNHATAIVRQYGLTTTDRVLQFASVSFDVAAEECFPTWIAGATVVLRPNEPVPAYADFHAFLCEQGLTVLNLPTPYWVGWVEEMERISLPDLPLVRLVIVGSEKALPDSLVRWQRVAGAHIAWCNSYGPTEATITASSYVPGREVDWATMATVPIGRPIANVELYVLDANMQPVSLGVPGDLYIGGLGLARGYHHMPALTAEKFIPHPFSRQAGERLYRTGDRVRRGPDGQVEFLGRRDDQVKIRGFRIELADIEFHARQCPQVKEARVYLESGSDSDLPALIDGLSEIEQDRMLQDVECLTAMEAQWIYDVESDVEERRKTVIQRKPEFDVYLKINNGEFLNPPRENQRNWIMRRALDEFSDDLVALDALSKRFVPGSDRVSIQQSWTGSRAEYTPSELVIEGQQVMQDWEAPLMKAMADIATEARGDVLEVGFGMGISASYIQAGEPRSHTIIECNRDVMTVFSEWTGRYPDRDIRLVQGQWQEVLETLPEFDAIFFDTYPASEAEFEESVINSINFAEAFMPSASKLLRPGGVFTYYTNEIDSFSRRHQRFLFQHFSSFTLSIVRSLLPPEDCHYWWADSMAVVKAVK